MTCVIVNEEAIEPNDDLSDIDWENEALDSELESESDTSEINDKNNNNERKENDVDVQTNGKNRNNENNYNNRNNRNNRNNGNNDINDWDISNDDLSQIKYDINKKKQGKNNKNKFKKQKTNSNFSKKAKNRKFKIVKNKNKNKSKQNGKTSGNIRIKRKKKHEKNKQKQQQILNKRQIEKKQLIMQVKAEKINKLMSSDTKLNKDNIKFIGEDEKIVKAALGIRIEVLLKNTKITTNQIIELVNTSTADELLTLINNEKIIEIVLQRFENENRKDEKKKDGNEQDPRDRDKSKGKREFNKVGIDKDGMGIMTETKGMDQGILEESGDENENENRKDGDENGSMDEDDISGTGAGVGVGVGNVVNAGNTENVGVGLGNVGDNMANEPRIGSGDELDIFKMNGIDASKFNMCIGTDANNIDDKISSLQNKAKEGLRR